MVGIDNYKLHLCKGEYYTTSMYRNELASLIYPLPTEISLGTHIVLHLDGSIGFGPNAYYVDEIDYSMDDSNKKSFLERMGESQVWKSIIRSGVPRSRRQRMYAVLGNVFLHLHPARLPKHAVKIGYTWCMGGLSFFLFVVLTITGILLMFYYRPTVEYAYTDMIDLTEQVPLGIMRELHRWGAHAMVLTVWLHMLRVFMTGSYKPPREFNWGVGVLLMTMTLFLSFYRLSSTLGSTCNLGCNGWNQYG